MQMKEWLHLAETDKFLAEIRLKAALLKSESL